MGRSKWTERGSGSCSEVMSYLDEIILDGKGLRIWVRANQRQQLFEDESVDRDLCVWDAQFR